jgi:hypothetical protein
VTPPSSLCLETHNAAKRNMIAQRRCSAAGPSKSPGHNMSARSLHSINTGKIRHRGRTPAPVCAVSFRLRGVPLRTALRDDNQRFPNLERLTIWPVINPCRSPTAPLLETASARPVLRSFLLGHHSHTEVNGDGGSLTPHQKRAVPPRHTPARRPQLPQSPSWGRFTVLARGEERPSGPSCALSVP